MGIGKNKEHHDCTLQAEKSKRRLGKGEKRLRALTCESRVETSGVALPDVHKGVGQGVAVGVGDIDAQFEGQARLVLSNLCPEQLFLEVEGALHPLRRQGALANLIAGCQGYPLQCLG